MLNKAHLIVSAVAVAAIVGCAAPTQRVGQSATVEFGVVRSAEQIVLDSAAARGALVGGTLGVANGRGGSSLGNAIRGATFGAAAKAAAEGDRSGMMYTVDMLDGSSTSIVTDQREIQADDCVAVERVRDTANIRRAAASYCDAANQQAVRAEQASLRSEAVQCESAKQELADAASDAAADLAIRKVELLCND